jgi:hypothetical protein
MARSIFHSSLVRTTLPRREFFPRASFTDRLPTASPAEKKLFGSSGRSIVPPPYEHLLRLRPR